MHDEPFLERLYLSLTIIRPGSVSAYVLASFVVAVVTALCIAVEPDISGSQLLLPVFGIMIATLVCGMRAGTLAGGLAFFAVWYFIIPTRYSFHIEDQVQINNLLSFISFGIAEVTIVGVLRSALRHSANLRTFDVAIFNSNPDAVIVIDTAGRVVRVNDSTLTMFGYTRDLLVGQTADVLIPERFRTRYEEFLKIFAAAPQGRPMGRGLDFFALRANGGEFPVDIQIAPVLDDWGSRLLVTVRDITEEKIAAAAIIESRRQQAIFEERQSSAEALRQANAKLGKIIESAPVAIWAIDADERITIWNPAVVNIYGISAVDAIGKPWRDLPSGRVPPGAQSSESLVKSAFEQDGFKDVEVRRVAIDGTELELRMSSAILRDANDQPTGMLCIAHDVGSIKELERKLRQAQKMEAVGQLTGGVAHDFNNLLAVIQGNLELLGERLDNDPPSRELVQGALTAAEHGSGLTHQLLAFSRQQQLMATAVDVGALVSRTIEMLRRMIEETIAIHTTIAPDLRRSRIDSGQLANAVLNLVVNARDAMPSGGKLTIVAENAVLDEDYRRHHDEVAPGRYVKVSITDTGVGMPKAVLDRAAEPFFTTKAVGKGSGLGLSMVFGFIKQSGGHLTIYSEEGLGTTISLYLPELRDDMPADAIQIERPAPIAGAQQMILLVEDNEALREFQIRVITSLGYRTLAAADGTSALQILNAAPDVDLLLTDIVLPGGISGPALAKAARSHRPDLRVIFMSGYAPQDLMQNYDLSDAQCLTKPFTRSDLAQALQQALTGAPPVSMAAT
ncbi:MAG: Histidine kinase [Rhodospirillales bacterium]|nr:Histidine kinase [Rhodospirillales bacterium]